MAKETKIERAEATWNPVTGCTKVSAGCDNCYAETLANRLRGPAFPNGFAPTLKPHKLGEPLARRNERVTWAKARGAKHRKGGDPAEWPANLRIREMPGGASV